MFLRSYSKLHHNYSKRRQNCNICTAITISDNNAGIVHEFELSAMSVHYIAYQENCFQEYSCKESIDVAWICWKSQKRIIIVSYPLYEDPHMNQDITKETQHYHCDDEGLKFIVKVNIYCTEIIKHKVIIGSPNAPLYCFQKWGFVWLHVRLA